MTNRYDIDVIFSLNSVNELEIRDKTSVVIDVLRTSSSIITALQNGADAIIPVADMGEASKIAMNVNSDNYLLCGDRDGFKIDGYDLGNSPFEYTEERISNKKLILNTTNGSKAIKKAFGSSDVCIAAFLNVSAVVTYLKNQKKEIVLICAGWKGYLTIEDMLLAGMIIHKLTNGELPEKSTDGVRAAFTLYDTYKDDILSVIHNSSHAIRHREISGAEDIEYCCQTDITDVLPYLFEKMIISKKIRVPV